MLLIPIVLSSKMVSGDDNPQIHFGGYAVSKFSTLDSALGGAPQSSSQTRVENNPVPATTTFDPYITCPHCGHQFTPSETGATESLEDRTGQYLVVPQQIYRPRNSAEVNCTPESVNFTSGEGSVPMSLLHALNNNFSTLEGRDATALNNSGDNISVRIEWPGYVPAVFQVKTRDWTSVRNRITKAKLGHEIAKGLNVWLENMENEPIAAVSRKWKVGSSRINLDSLYLSAINRVSKGSWQPQLYITKDEGRSE